MQASSTCFFRTLLLFVFYVALASSFLPIRRTRSDLAGVPAIPICGVSSDRVPRLLPRQQCHCVSYNRRGTDLRCGVAPPAFVKSALASIFYPGTSPDPEIEEPLPVGSYGCPFFGRNLFRGVSFYRDAVAKLGNPRVWKFYFFGKPYACVSGLRNVKEVLSTEFTNGGVSTGSNATTASSELFGRESLLLTRDNDLHNFLRRLVGASMTPASIATALPALENAANEHIDKMLKVERVLMNEVCTSYTLDIAWRQIIGLDLDAEEALYFQQQVHDWIEGVISWKTFLLPGFILRRTRPFRAHRYLVAKIEERIEALKEHGPDGSTLSAMLFAKDDEERHSKKLSHQQVIDNALLLILAGSETSAGTMANAVLFLGLHPDAWAKVKLEQEALMRKHGPTLTKSQLDKDCVYLESAIKEAMRIKPISSGSRGTEGTLVVEGKQIPKGWGIIWSIRQTHQFDPAVHMDDESHMDIVKGYSPERWLDDETRPTEFLAFGAGPRYCLGANLAMAEMKMFLALLARRVDFDLICSDANEIDWSKRSIVPKPADGVLVNVRPSAFEPSLKSVFA